MSVTPSTSTPQPITPRVETLVATDWSSKGLSIDPVVAFLGDALIEVEETSIVHWKTGELLKTFRVAFNADLIRNTEVNGRGYRAGFLVHLE